MAVATSVQAQALPAPLPEDGEIAIQGLDPGTRVLPVWSNVSGRVEALLLLDPVSGSESINPLDRLLAPQGGAIGFGGQLELDSGARLRSSLRVEADTGLALLCNGSLGASGALASLTDQCLLATLGQDDPLLRGIAQGAGVDLGWQSADELFDLSFGLSWLRRESGAPATNPRMPQLLAASGLDAADVDSVNALGFWTSQLDSQTLRLDGLINLGPQARMLIGGKVGRNRLLSGPGSALNWDTASISVGLGYRAFSGQVTGRLIELPGRSSQWAGLDIGLSWRTPWRGELSIGARNVLGNADNSGWPLAELPTLEEPAARTPYVRYHQDL